MSKGGLYLRDVLPCTCNPLTFSNRLIRLELVIPAVSSFSRRLGHIKYLRNFDYSGECDIGPTELGVTLPRAGELRLRELGPDCGAILPIVGRRRPYDDGGAEDEKRNGATFHWEVLNQTGKLCRKFAMSTTLLNT